MFQIHQGVFDSGTMIFAVGFPLFTSETKSETKVQNSGKNIVDLAIGHPGGILLRFISDDVEGHIVMELKMASVRKRTVKVTEEEAGWSNHGDTIL